MAFRLVTLAAALACVNIASANPYRAPLLAPAPCGRPALAAPCGLAAAALPAVAPTVVESVVPGPVIVGPQPAGVVEHASAPYEIAYFEKPWIVKHQQSAALSVYNEVPVVVDEYAAPSFSAAPAPPAVLVEQVYGAPTNIVPAPAAGYGYGAYGAYGGYGGYSGYGGCGAAPVAPLAYGCH